MPTSSEDCPYPTSRRRVRRAELGVEPLRGPRLFQPCDVGDVVVLDPGQVPDEPADRVRVVVEATVQLFQSQSGDGGVDALVDPPEGVDEEILTCHAFTLSRWESLRGRTGGGSGAMESGRWPGVTARPWRRAPTRSPTGIYRISTFVPGDRPARGLHVQPVPGAADEPLLFHTGMRQLFPRSPPRWRRVTARGDAALDHLRARRGRRVRRDERVPRRRARTRRSPTARSAAWSRSTTWPTGRRGRWPTGR